MRHVASIFRQCTMTFSFQKKTYGTLRFCELQTPAKNLWTAAFKRAATSRTEIANMYVQLQATCTNDLGSGSFSSHSHTQLHKINLPGQWHIQQQCPSQVQQFLEVAKIKNTTYEQIPMSFIITYNVNYYSELYRFIVCGISLIKEHKNKLRN